jgi:hypothetical protein
MRHYQQLLLTALEQHGWQLDERSHPEQAYIAEQWMVSSLRQHHGFRLFCTFIVDPQSDQPHDIAAVRSIAFTQERPVNWSEADSAALVLYPAQRGFPATIEPAMIQIDGQRTNAANGA